jgi:hypothetical protein
MLTVITFFWRLCMLRAHSAGVPTASWFVAAVAIGNVCMSILLSILWSPDMAPRLAATAVVVQQAALACLVWAGLYFRNTPNRFSATITAIFGCDLLLTALLGSFTPLLTSLPQNVFSSILFVFFVWSIAIVGHILHQAFEVKYMPGVAIAFGFYLLSAAVGNVVLE